MRPRLEAVRLLHAELGDTVALLGPDVMDFAYDGCQQLKLAGSGDRGLDDMRPDIGAQLVGRSQKSQRPVMDSGIETRLPVSLMAARPSPASAVSSSARSSM